MRRQPTCSTVVSTTHGQTPVQFSPNTIKGLVANALIDVATGQYQTGVALGALPAHTLLQGEFNQLANGVFLTQGVDTPTSGFATDANGTPKVPAGFTATTANTVLNALPFVTATGAGNNTLNTGDNLQTTGAATGATKLVDVTSNNTFAANAPFATAVTMNGVNALDITASTPGAGPGGAGVGGFRGDITGLLVENNLNSVGFVTLGGTGQGLKTLLTDINISGNGSNQVAGVGNFVNTVVLAAAAGCRDQDDQHRAHGQPRQPPRPTQPRDCRSLTMSAAEPRPLPTSPTGPGRLRLRIRPTCSSTRR